MVPDVLYYLNINFLLKLEFTLISTPKNPKSMAHKNIMGFVQYWKIMPIKVRMSLTDHGKS